MVRSPLIPRLLLACAFLLAGCSSQPDKPQPIGEAYVGPVTLSIRQDLALKSQVVGTASHGDRLDVLQTRRRFVRVRTEKGVVGWVDSRQLLSTGQMQALRHMAESAAQLPAMGRAAVFEALNVHSEPSRQSPSFAQIPEGGSVEVIGHKIAPRTAKPTPSQPIVPPRPPSARKKGKDKKEKTAKGVPPPPLPPVPAPPPNWLELSRSAPPEPGAEDEKDKEKDDPKPVPIDDWSFVRTKDGKAGWVLSRMLSMSIPDEVAQYAEGHRITSYFPLADVQDGDQTRHFWLWTTMSANGVPYEFDSFRVFVWSLKRHRYETAYIERNVVGYYPVEAKKGNEKGEGATFSLILDNDGAKVRKTYLFNGYRVSLLKKEPYQPDAEDAGGSASPAAPDAAAQQASKSWWQRLKDRFSGKK